MGLYLRKGFRLGPIRLNLSKSGLGVSGGIKGAKIGIGPRGTYFNGGSDGLYYRKHLGSGKKAGSPSSASQGDGFATVLLAVLIIGLSVCLFRWFVANPMYFVIGIAVIFAVFVVYFIAATRRENAIIAYKELLDDAFLSADSLPSASIIRSIKRQQKRLPTSSYCKKEIEQMESEFFRAVLTKVLDDGFISSEETAVIESVEQTLLIGANSLLCLKKEIFYAAYSDAIQDRHITPEERDKIENLILGLAIPEEEIKRELDIVREFVEMQKLHLPFESILPKLLAAPVQKSEQAFYQCPVQVLSRRKSKDSPTGYEYTVRRDGTMILTNKRIFVVGKGTTNIRYSEIEDVEIDVDENIIEILRSDSKISAFLRTDTPIYTGRAIDLLVKAGTERETR